MKDGGADGQEQVYAQDLSIRFWICSLVQLLPQVPKPKECQSRGPLWLAYQSFTTKAREMGYSVTVAWIHLIVSDVVKLVNLWSVCECLPLLW